MLCVFKLLVILEQRGRIKLNFKWVISSPACEIIGINSAQWDETYQKYALLGIPLELAAQVRVCVESETIHETLS